MDGMNFMSINCHSDSLFNGTDIQQIPTTLLSIYGMWGGGYDREGKNEKSQE